MSRNRLLWPVGALFLALGRLEGEIVTLVEGREQDGDDDANRRPSNPNPVIHLHLLHSVRGMRPHTLHHPADFLDQRSGRNILDVTENLQLLGLPFP